MTPVRTSLVRTFLAAFTSMTLLAGAQAPAKPVQPNKPEDWYRKADRKSLILRDVMIDADEGQVDAMVPLALTLLSGWGRAEGPNPQLAIYWFNAAADRGDHKALEHLAVVYATGEAVPRDEKKSNSYLDAYAAKSGNPIKSEECGDDEACSRFRHLVAAQSKILMEYPRQARIDGLGGEFHAELDLVTKKVKVTGEKHLDLFGPPLGNAVEAALKQIQLPAGLAERRKTLKLNFNMQVGS